MDEDEELTDDLALSLGKLVIVHTLTPDGEATYETGLLMGMGEAGVRLRVTHRVDRVYPEVTVGEKVLVEQEVLKLSRVELVMVAWKAGDKLAVTRKKAELVEIAVNEAIEMVEEGKRPYDTLRPLNRTVSTFLPWDTVTKVVSFDEWHEEMQLRPFAVALSDVEEAAKVPETAEKE